MTSTEPIYDVVIIGSGAGGGASAWALSRNGLKVLLLEAGPAYDPLEDYRLDKADWEQSRFPYKQGATADYSFGSMQTLENRWRDLRSWNHASGLLNPGKKRRGWKYHHVQGLGGSTLHFTGEAHRLNPKSMKLKSRFGVGADWPVTYAELEPHYCVAERIIGVAGPNKDGMRTRSEPYPLPPHPMSYASARLAKSGKIMGLQWTTNPVAALSEPYDGRPGCNYCGNCNRGCPRKDKGSVDVTFLRRAAANGNCEIKTNCVVTRLVAGPDDQVSEAHYIDARGQHAVARGRLYIVSGGAVQTPRLLLNSSNAHAPDGLANDSGQVGKNFMESISWVSCGLHPDPLGSHRGLPSDIICWDYNEPDAIPDTVGGCRFSPGTAEADLLGPINYAQRVVPGWGLSHKRAMRETLGHCLAVGALGECLPNPLSYIDLDPTRVDAQQIPIARINTRLEETNIKRLQFMANKTREILDAAGCSKIFEEYGTYDMFSSTHVFGTCRMGEDPDQSVVDSYCRSHRWRNLYIVDASVFPSSGGGESPSLTIEALAIRTAAHIYSQDGSP